MSDIGEYKSLDFDIINNVELVDKTDRDFIEWRNFIYNKNCKTKSQIRREEERKKYPEEWEELKLKYLNRKCGDCKKLYKYPDGYVCWGDGTPNKSYLPNSNSALTCAYFKLNVPFVNSTKGRTWCKHLNLHDSNVEYYLHDIGVLEIDKKLIGEQAKKYEYQFKQKLQKISEITIIDKFFKIYRTNDTITFKIPDVIFKQNNNHYSIIEYKADAWLGNFQQLRDYEKLFGFAAIESLQNLYWIIHSFEINCHWCSFNDFKNKAKDIQILTEKDFLEQYDNKGLDSWM